MSPTDPLVDTYLDMAEALKGPLAPPDSKSIVLAPDERADWNAPGLEKFLPGEEAGPKVTNFTPTHTPARSESNVMATFSEAMDPATINASTVTLVDWVTATQVKAEVTYDMDNHKVELNPTDLLTEDRKYIATVKGGAAGVRSQAGNQLVDENNQLIPEKVLCFTVAASVP